MRMSSRLRGGSPSAMRTQSLSRRSPVTSRVLSMRPSLASSRVTSCSGTFPARTRLRFGRTGLGGVQGHVQSHTGLAHAGRPASNSRSDLFRPLIFRSTSEKPVVRPGMVFAACGGKLPSRSMTACSTTLMGTMFWALRPGGWHRFSAPPPPERRWRLAGALLDHGGDVRRGGGHRPQQGLFPDNPHILHDVGAGGGHLHQLDQIAPGVVGGRGPLRSISPATVTPSMGLE